MTSAHVAAIPESAEGLVRRAVRGDQAAFARIVRLHHADMVRVCFVVGGDLSIMERLRDEPRVNRPGGLIALIGRENVSVATAIVRLLDEETQALLVGEATPARAANFTCPCEDLTLSHSGIIVSVPTSWDRPGDPRPAIEPDIPMSLSSTDFFAGRDPVLDAALAGLANP